MNAFKERMPGHGTVVAYLALFVALGGVGAYAADKIGSKDIAPNAIKGKHVKDEALSGGDILDGTLMQADLGVTVTTVDVSYPALNAGQCAFVSAPVTGLTAPEGVLALTNPDWDNRLMITGVESVGSAGEELRLEICNHTPSTNLGNGVNTITLLRYPEGL
jgi:hypothetical protein